MVLWQIVDFYWWCVDEVARGNTEFSGFSAVYSTPINPQQLENAYFSKLATFWWGGIKIPTKRDNSF